MIDLSGAGVPQRNRFPAPHGTRSITGERPAPGTARSIGQTTRARTTSEDIARARKSLGESTASIRSRTVTRDDILARYRGSSAESADSRVRHPSQLPMLSSERRGVAQDASASDARRAAAARTAADVTNADRISAARAKQQSNTQRTSDARAKKKSNDERRMAVARENYLSQLAESSTAPARLDAEGVANSSSSDDHWDDDHHHHHHHYNHHFWGFWGNCGWWGPYWYWSYGVGYWWHSYWYYGCPGFYGYYPRYYWYGPFVPYRSVIYDSEPEVIYIDSSDDEVIYVDEGEAAAPAPDPVAQQALNRASDYYLTLGDRSFREGRYGDAVHFYAKAVEFAPDTGILYLILSDALFATGDYHYAAYAVRRAFELDPGLASNVVDKHSFYSDPMEFERQLAVLERYLEDHFLDDDARLVLAANYLFGGRPAAAVDLLESAFSLTVKDSPAGQLLLEAGRVLQYGEPVEQDD